MSSRRSACFVIFLFLLYCIPTPLHSQFGNGPGNVQTGNLNVRVTDANGRPVSIRVRIRVLRLGTSVPTAEGYTNDSGFLQLNGIPIGDYHLLATGDGVEDTDSGIFQVDNRKTTQTCFVAVRSRKDSQVQNDNRKGSLVSADDFKIPKKASKQFDQASIDLAKSNWQNAIDHLQKAIHLFPNYAAAYNNLGVAYSRIGDKEHEREALEKAIDLDPHLASALLNLARMSMLEHRYSEAEVLLNRAVGADPTNLQGLMLLAQTQLLTAHYADVIASMRKVHSIPKHEPFAAVHLMAARAFEHENRFPDAVLELQTFLREEPEGQRAELVRKELTKLQASSK